MGYEDSIQCRMLATHCAICGRPLVDARSVERGIGPECWETHGYDGVDVGDDQREMANKLVYAAALYAQQGRVTEVLKCSDAIRAIGLETLAERIADRFQSAAKSIRIRITADPRDATRMLVYTPFRRGEKNEFIAAWRAIPSRRYGGNGSNSVLRSDRPAVWALLQRFFPSVYGQAEDGSIFRITEAEEVAHA